MLIWLILVTMNYVFYSDINSIHLAVVQQYLFTLPIVDPGHVVTSLHCGDVNKEDWSRGFA